jgi:hypothetical protein
MPEVETKTGLQLPTGLRELFRSGLSSREEELAKINAWAKSNVRLLLMGEADFDAAAEDLAVPNQEVYRSLQLIATLLYRSDPVGSVDVEGYAAALEETGSDLPAKARILLDGIQLDRSEAEFARQRGMVSQAILPTLSSASALCELRAIFQDLPSPSATKSHREAVSKLLGFEPMVVVGLELNDSSGNDSSCTFQMTEKSLRNIVKTFEDALVQLEVMREYQKRFSVRS